MGRAIKRISPIVMGKHEEKENEYLNKVEAKTKSYKTLFEYLNTFVSIDQPERYEGKIIDEFLERFYDKHHAAFPTLSLAKILELHSCYRHKVDALVSAFESIDMEWDFTKNQPKHEAPDFQIYATTENEIKLYTYLTDLIKVQEKVKESGINFHPAPFIQSFPFALTFDFATNSVKPNIDYIKGSIR